MYNLINNKDKSMKDFQKFMRFMIENNQYVGTESFEYSAEDYQYHFNNIPKYLEDFMFQFKYDLTKGVGGVSMASRRLNETIEKYT